MWLREIDTVQFRRKRGREILEYNVLDSRYKSLRTPDLHGISLHGAESAHHVKHKSKWGLLFQRETFPEQILQGKKVKSMLMLGPGKGFKLQIQNKIKLEPISNFQPNLTIPGGRLQT